MHSRLQFTDTTVTKTFTDKKLLENEINILRHLEEQDCHFVPRVISRDDCSVTMTRLPGSYIEIGSIKLKSLFDDLLTYGVEHGDRRNGNVLFDRETFKFYIIDFELGSIIS